MCRFTSLLLIVLCSPWVFGQEDLSCLTPQQVASSRLYNRLQKQAYEKLDARDEAFEKLQSVEQIEAYQQRLREFFIERLGGFPERCPLESKTLGTLDDGAYVIEKVIFQSRPGHHITANLYLPKADHTPAGGLAGVIVSSGHSRTAKTADYNQRFGIALATHGMAALCFDPIGQGERSQFLSAEGEAKFSSTTTEHFLIGVGSTLVGRNTASYRVWDAMRAIDYLVERPEINPDRIGMTGCSGGGTLTSYVMALDQRVRCAAPACYLTTLRNLIQTIGPQDSEQNIYGQLAFGMDHPDYLLMRAPRPTLISSTTGDYFAIEGAWDNFRQAKRVYGKLGHPERVDLVETEGGHGVKPQNLASIVQWMRRWLMDIDEPIAAREYPVRQPTTLHCLNPPQVLSLPGEKSVLELNREYAQQLGESRVKVQKDLGDEKLRRAVAVKIGIDLPDPERRSPTWEDLGSVSREGYHIDKLYIDGPGGRLLPALTYHPPSPVDEAYLYLHDDGKIGDGAPGGAIEEILDQGYAVVAVDLSGQGETTTKGARPSDLLTDWKTYYLSYLLERPLLGIRVADALAAADFVRFYQKKTGKSREVHLVGAGRTGIVALHAAALAPEVFSSVTLRKTPKSWTEVLGQSVPAGQLDMTVHGALELYDLPDLVALAGETEIQFE